MSPERQIYLLDPQKLDPETIAVAFAKTSRSPQSFRKIAAELTAEKSAEFHEKWVVGYGHASVAEHAVLHVAIENVSRLAVETIESSRLASYTEKSTRYQKWTPEEFYTPPEIARDFSPALRTVYQETCAALFAAYEKALPAIRQEVEHDRPRIEGESDGAWERRIRSEYVDAARFLLPAASLANLGMTINARALEYALCKMLSHPLEEVRQVGAEIKAVAMESVPTLLKYVNEVPYLVETGEELARLSADQADQADQEDPIDPIDPADQADSADWCALVNCDDDGETRVLAAALYRYGELSYTQARARVQAMTHSEREALAAALLSRLSRHDIPLREVEHAHYTFDVIIDQGGYFELKRHRMMTQTAQPLTTHLGYAMPKLVARAGIEADYCKAMEMAARAYDALAQANPHAAAYVVPNAYNRRVLLDCNLRSVDHFVSLRSASNAHFSMRRLALRMAEEVRQTTPLLGRYLRDSKAETWQQVEQEHFSRV